MFKILVVDDHPDTADILCMLLRTLGHDARAAYTGQSGLEAIESFQPDIAILDIGLPDISGYDIARMARSRPNGSRMFIAAATGWGTPEDRVKALAAGFDLHLLKPVDAKALKALIDRASRKWNTVRTSPPPG